MDFLNQWFEAARFGAEMQRVVALRTMRIAAGGPTATSETQRMISEKMSAFGESQMAMMTALATGSTLDVAAAKAYAPYRRRVRANSRRLGG